MRTRFFAACDSFSTVLIHAAFTAITFVLIFSSFTEGSQVKNKNKHYHDLISVTFPDENNGWACGRLGTILHTKDGGRTWSRQESQSKFTLSSISFADAKNGWVVGDGGTILSTQNGGESWEKQESPVDQYLFGVDFVNPDEGWIVSGYTTILHTSDGGKTWAVQYEGEDFFLKAVSFCDSLHGWAVGEYGFIYGTTDGGTTWKRQAGHYRISESDGEIDAETILFDVKAVDPQTVWALGIDGKIVRTTDGGKTWEKVETDAPPRHLFGIAVGKAGSVLAVGNGIVLFSGDNGQTWQNSSVFDLPIKYGWLYGATPCATGFAAVGGQGTIYLFDASRFLFLEGDGSLFEATIKEELQ